MPTFGRTGETSTLEILSQGDTQTGAQKTMYGKYSGHIEDRARVSREE
jgi:hypothetical protein